MSSEAPKESTELYDLADTLRRAVEAPILYVTTVNAALLLAARQMSQLQITPAEYLRYFGKAHNLAANYVGFSQKGTLAEARSAGRAGALACIYDVLSDWGKLIENPEVLFEKILDEEVSEELKKLAIDLFKKDMRQGLETDGLERGYVALLFTLKVMNLDEFYEKEIGVRNLGEILQIVDDIWDLDQDTAEDQTNCLRTERKMEHLKRLLTFCENTRPERLFPHGPLLVQVIKSTEKKAKQLLTEL